jgi:hypothetical protein
MGVVGTVSVQKGKDVKQHQEMGTLWEGEIPFERVSRGTNIRSATSLDEEGVETLARDILLNGQLQSVLVYAEEWDEEMNPTSVILWDGFQRFAALEYINNTARPYPVKVRVTEKPRDIGAWQLRANNYHEMAPGEIARAVAPLFQSLRRKDWKKRLGKGQPYTKGAGSHVQDVTGLSQTRASRYGSVLAHDDLAALWHERPSIPLEVMLDAAKLDVSGRIALFLDAGLVNAEALGAVYGASAVQGVVDGDGGRPKGSKEKKGRERPTHKALETACGDMGLDDDPALSGRLLLLFESLADIVDPEHHEMVEELATVAIQHGAILALEWALGRGPSPVGATLPESGEPADSEGGGE